MDQQPSRLDQWVVRYAAGVLKWRWPVLLASIMAVMAMAYGGQYLTMGTNYRIFFKGDNPQLVAFEKLQDIYTQNDNLLFVVEPADGEVFTPANIDAIQALAEEAWQIPYALRVDAVTNFQHTRAEGDDLRVSDLVEVETDSDQALMDTMRVVSLGEPLVRSVETLRPGHLQRQVVYAFGPSLARIAQRILLGCGLQSTQAGHLDKWSENDMIIQLT